MTTIIGKPLDRKDARLKVTGAAQYAAEFPAQNLAYGFPVRSAIAKGRIAAIDQSAAEKADGVISVLTHKTAERINVIDPMAVAAYGTAPGETLLPLQTDEIHYVGQYIALVVAETYEQARYAAGLLKIDYETKPPAVELAKEKANGYQPEKFFGAEEVQIKRGDAETAFNAAPVKFEQTYRTPTENHHPMETHATIAIWNSRDNLTLYDATQAVKGTQAVLAQAFKLKVENVRIRSPFVGGGFGCKGLVWMHPVLAAMGARAVKRPVKIVLTRQMMQTNVGRRGETEQKIQLGADANGQLSVIKHHTDTYTTTLSEFFEPPGLMTKLLYAVPNLAITHNVARLNVGTPTPMRAPGESPGTFALESAMDELAHELKIDPVQLRLTNYAAKHPHDGREWSSNFLRECYQTGIEKFGWNKRKTQPRQTRDGRFLIGYGMATATYPGYRSPASARVRVMADGTAIVASATQDIGTGTYTVLMQVAAEYLGIPVERIKPEIGDSSLPTAPTSGGSQTVASVAPAVKQACDLIREQVLQIVANDQKSPLFNRKPAEIMFADGKIFVTGDSSKSETYAEILRRHNKPMLEACVTANVATPEAKEEPRNPAVEKSAQQNQAGAGAPPCSPFTGEQDADQKKFAFQSHGAQFAEVGVDEDLGIVRVRRFVSVQDIGKVMNEKTARSQVYSGVIYGIGMALMEETVYDPRTARPVIRTLADYHVPVNLDVPPIEVYLINKPDPHINALGARGIGEIGITGVAAAIANAVFNATGKRVRDLPLTPDKLL